MDVRQQTEAGGDIGLHKLRYRTSNLLADQPGTRQVQADSAMASQYEGADLVGCSSMDTALPAISKASLQDNQWTRFPTYRPRAVLR